MLDPLCGFNIYYEEFDPGSERTLAGCLKHASRAAALRVASGELVSNAWVSASWTGIASGNRN